MWILGAICLLLAAIAGFVFIRSRARIHEMIVTETYTAKELAELQEAAAGAAGDGVFKYRSEVKGSAEAGPDGLLRAELSDTECLWHQHVVTRKYWTTERRTDSKGNDRTRRVERTEKVAARQSDQPFLLRDQTGAVAVHPAGAMQDMEKVVERFEAADEASTNTKISLGKFNFSIPTSKREGTIGYKYEEWILRAGKDLYVLGDVVDPSGQLAITEPEFVTTQDEETRIAKFKLQAKVSLGLAILVGLVGVILIPVDLLSS
jgi:hypothetical protein